MARDVVEAGMCFGRAVCRILGLARSTFWYRDRGPSEEQRQLLKRMKGTLRPETALGLPPDRGALTAGRLAGGQATDPATAPKRGAARATDQAEGLAPRGSPPDCRRRRVIAALSGHGTSSRTPRCAGERCGCLPSPMNAPGSAMSCERIGHSRRLMCSNGSAKPSRPMAHPSTCAATTARSSSPRRSSVGWPSIRSDDLYRCGKPMAK